MATIAVKGDTFTFDVCLYSQADTKLLQNTPTIAAGDFQRSINGDAFANLDNLPIVKPAGSESVEIVLSAAETTAAGTGGRIMVKWEDVADAEWCSGYAVCWVYDAESQAQSGDAYAETALVHAHAATIEAAAVTAAAYAVMTSGPSFRGVIANIPGPDHFVVTSFIGFGAGAFLSGAAQYQVYVWRDAGGLGAAPQGEMQPVVDYNSATGDFEHNPFTVPLVAGDEVMLLHPRVAEMLLVQQNTAAILADTGTDGVVLTSTGLAASAAAEIAVAAWANTTRTLTVPTATPLAVVTTALPAIVTGVGYAYTLSGMTIPATWAKCYVTFKDNPDIDTDARSLVQLMVTNPGNPATDGLIRLNRAAGVLAQGSLVVNQPAGTVAISLTATASVALAVTEALWYDCKFITAAGVADRQAYGNVAVVAGITRAVT